MSGVELRPAEASPEAQTSGETAASRRAAPRAAGRGTDNTAQRAGAKKRETRADLSALLEGRILSGVDSVLEHLQEEPVGPTDGSGAWLEELVDPDLEIGLVEATAPTGATRERPVSAPEPRTSAVAEETPERDEDIAGRLDELLEPDGSEVTAELEPEPQPVVRVVPRPALPSVAQRPRAGVAALDLRAAPGGPTQPTRTDTEATGLDPAEMPTAEMDVAPDSRTGSGREARPAIVTGSRTGSGPDDGLATAPDSRTRSERDARPATAAGAGGPTAATLEAAALQTPSRITSTPSAAIPSSRPGADNMTAATAPTADVVAESKPVTSVVRAAEPRPVPGEKPSPPVVATPERRERGPGVGVSLGWLSLVAGLMLVPVGWRDAVLDDAFITFRYARSFVDGQGLVFNPGERVEGYTSLLWTLLSALGLRLELALPGFIQIFGVLCNLLIAFGTYAYARRRLGHSAVVAMIAPMFLMANLNTGAWAALGMETPLFSLLVLGGILLSAPEEDGRLPSPVRAVGGAALMAAATFARPEGILYFGVAMLPRLFALIRRRRPTLEDFAVVAAFAVPVAALFLWRHSYYGEWLPNTFYAKATGGAGRTREGLSYLADFFDRTLLQGLLVLPIAGAIGRLRRGPRPLLLGMVLATIVYVVVIGGDAFAGARFFTPILAPLYLLIQDGLWTFLTGNRLVRPLIALFVLATGLLTILTTGAALARQADIATAMTRNRAYLGKLLSYITEPGTVIALNTVGALPYYADRPVIDLYGLTDAHIARQAVRPLPGGGTGHEKGDGRYVLDRKPEIILLRNVWLADVPIEAHRALHGVSEREIAVDARFEAQYTAMNLRLRPDLMFGFYVRRDVDQDEIRRRFSKLDLTRLGPLEKLSAERGMEQLLHEEGNRLAAEGNLEAARERYEQALELYPGGGEVHLALGQLFERQGKLEASREHYLRATELLAESAPAWLGLGNIEARLGQTGSAITAYRKSLFVDPTQVDAYANLSSQLLKEGRYEEAVPALRGGLARSQNDLELWIRLGTAYGVLQRWNDAREALKRAQGIAPKDPRTQTFEKWLTARLPATR